MRALKRAETRDAVVELYQRQYPATVRLAHLLVHDNAVAEDLAQEAFVRLYSHWDQVEDIEAAPGYLRTTLVNLARGHGRKQGVAQRWTPDPELPARSAEDVAVTNSQSSAVVEALQRLSPRQKECLVLRHYEGLTESQIAGAVGCAVGSVRTHVKRGMAALAAMLDDPMDDPELGSSEGSPTSEPIAEATP